MITRSKTDWVVIRCACWIAAVIAILSLSYWFGVSRNDKAAWAVLAGLLIVTYLLVPPRIFRK